MVGQLGHVEPAVLIERDLDRVENVGFGSELFNAEPVDHLERFESLVRIERFAVG